MNKQSSIHELAKDLLYALKIAQHYVRYSAAQCEIEVIAKLIERAEKEIDDKEEQ